MTKKKETSCKTCKHLINTDCTHPDNIGYEIKYRQEKQIFMNKPEVINGNGNCANYEKS